MHAYLTILVLILAMKKLRTFKIILNVTPGVYVKMYETDQHYLISSTRARQLEEGNEEILGSKSKYMY